MDGLEKMLEILSLEFPDWDKLVDEYVGPYGGGDWVGPKLQKVFRQIFEAITKVIGYGDEWMFTTTPKDPEPYVSVSVQRFWTLRNGDFHHPN